MKRLLITLTLCLLAFGVQAGTFAGISWEGNPGFIVGGEVVEISPKVRTLGYARISIDSASYDNGLKTSKALGAEVTYHLINKSWDLHLVGGPTADWANPSESRDDVFYITQALGGILTVPFPIVLKVPILKELFDEEPILFFGAKYRFQAFEKSSFENNTVLAIGLGKDF